MHRRVGSFGLPTVFTGGLESASGEGGSKDGGLKAAGSWVTSNTSWDGVSQVLSAAQMVFGVVILFASSFYLMHSGKTAGQVIGLASVLLGACGCWGVYNQKPHFQTLFVVGMAFMALLTFEFIGQVGRDVEVHCNFAESHARIAHLEDKIVALKHDEMVSQLFLRMNELDDMLGMVSTGTIHTIELRNSQKKLADQDRNYIEEKITALQHHADEVLDHIYEQAKKLEAEHGGDPQKLEEQKEIRNVLQGHLNNIEIVLDHLKQAETDGHQLNYDEYEVLFRALVEGHTESETLKTEEQHLPFVKAAMERQKEDTYHQYDMTNKGEELAKSQKEKALARERFEELFLQTVEKHPTMSKDHFEKSLVTALEDLPGHCLQEMSSYSVMKWGGWALIASQMMAAYVTVTSIAVARKKDN